MSNSVLISFRHVILLTFFACLAVSFYGYYSGWPLWEVLLWLGVVPIAVFCVWMYTGSLRRYRFLFGIYGVLALFGVFEAWEHGRINEAFARSIDLPKNPGEPNLYFEYDLPSVEAELFPDSSETMLIQAIQLNYCMDQTLPFHQHPFCRKFEDSSKESVRRLVEAALEKQPKTNEDLYYSYIEIVMRTGGSASDVDAAANEWKRLFPFSKRPDPRQSVARPQ